MKNTQRSEPLTEAAYYILLSLTSPLHGYGIIQKVRRMTGDRLVLAAGTLYGALTNLTSKGWIKTVDENGQSRKKEYIITADGKQALKDEYKRLKELVSNAKDILEGEDI